MITAQEARAKANEIKFANIDQNDQLNDVKDCIDKAMKRGEHHVRYKEQIHPEVEKQLSNLGYRVTGGGLNSSSKFIDVISW